MRRPRLSPYQERFLTLAFTREKMHRVHHHKDGSQYAIKRDRDTVHVLERLGLVVDVTHSDWKIVVDYRLTPAGELLARALLDLKTRRIAASRGGR